MHKNNTNKNYNVQKTEQQWQEILTPQEYSILREHGTERAGTSPLNIEKREGMFLCKACNHQVFDSSTKYDSRSGWPSFFAPLTPDAVGTSQDQSYGMTRTEVHCNNCGSHLGHVFDDGPRETTGQRYCINGAALKFMPNE